MSGADCMRRQRYQSYPNRRSIADALGSAATQTPDGAPGSGIFGAQILYSRPALEALLCLEINQQKSDIYWIIKENMTPGRGLELERFLEEIQDVKKSRLRFTCQLAR